MIDEEKLHFFVSEVCISDNFSMAESGYKSLNVEEKTSLLNKYYSERKKQACLISTIQDLMIDITVKRVTLFLFCLRP